MKAAKKNIRMKQTDPYLEQKERLEDFRKELQSIKVNERKLGRQHNDGG